ncbi:hypothetical protein FDECE_2622 [Fusarium decemcellulare]|nr:hypothetical protein FDECE_2622 [Fusarium decemcellulare]
MLREWFQKNPDDLVRVTSDFGEIMVLPPAMADEIRNHAHLSFSAVAKDVTYLKDKITEPLAIETAEAMKDVLGQSRDWQAFPLRQKALRLVARASSRVFLGEELCRDDKWLRLSEQYTTDSIAAADKLRMWPPPLRGIAGYFLPYMRDLRRQVEEAKQLIVTVMERRREKKAEALAEGMNLEYDDALEWFGKSGEGGKGHLASMQLFLSVVAIHTTTDLLMQVIYDLAMHPEYVDPLREEVRKTIGENGWKKSSLYNMKLLDSVIKESQRLKPIQMTTMLRRAQKDIQLSTGQDIRRGEVITVSSHQMWDTTVYENADEWNGYRFYTMRHEAGKENTAQLVSTSVEHVGFGLGIHACPGRFFAANELKVVLSLMLMNYDWRLTTDGEPNAVHFGFNMAADPRRELDFRKCGEWRGMGLAPEERV